MDTIYSVTLLVSLVFGAVGAMLAAVAMFTRKRGWRLASLRPVMLFCGTFSLVVGIVSAVVHGFFDHSAVSPEPMNLYQFFDNHTAYWIVLICSVLIAVGLYIDKQGSSRDH